MKKLLSMVTLVSLLVGGCQSELKVKVLENVKTEYGEKLNDDKLFNIKDSDENVKVSKVEGFNSKKIGEQELIITFTDGNKTKEEELKVTVEDTKSPIIELKQDMISITSGDKLELKDNIKLVKDPVDGNLKYSNKAVEKDGYYFDKGKLDTKKEGTYEVKVIAIDRNGNKTEKKFKVSVKTAKKQSSSNIKTGNTINKSTNSGGSSISKPSNSGSSQSSNNNSYLKNQCEFGGGVWNESVMSCSTSFETPDFVPNDENHQHRVDLSNSGYSDLVTTNMWFKTLEEVDSWASNYWGPNNEWSSFNYSAEQCSCGMWNPYFFNIGYWE